ncbi:hypothetical protein T07_8319 [Trichinella nelsoni]|uniref:Uncharacterized protein n=1 Tax=Trichinella nelsoni TaxID=6336 RepID=A0A0V0SKI3_9BILA|nr:hypothetical protein T07_8319 [Trichinella nelsoni]
MEGEQYDFSFVVEAVEKLYEDIILLPRNISWQKNRSTKYSGVKLHAGKENRKTVIRPHKILQGKHYSSCYFRARTVIFHSASYEGGGWMGDGWATELGVRS